MMQSLSISGAIFYLLLALLLPLYLYKVTECVHYPGKKYSTSRADLFLVVIILKVCYLLLISNFRIRHTDLLKTNRSGNIIVTIT